MSTHATAPTEADRSDRLPRDRRAALRRGAADPRHRPRARCASRSCRTSASGSRRASCRRSWRRSSASSACSACTSTATAAPGASADRLRPRLPGARGRRLRASAASSRCRARWRCTRSGAGAPRSRSSSGCRGWRAGEAIGCFGLTEPDAGSDPGAMRTRARRDGDDWILNGAEDVDHQRLGRRRRGRVGADRRRHPRLPRPRRARRASPRPGHPQEALAARVGHVASCCSTTCALPGRRDAARGDGAARPARRA